MKKGERRKEKSASKREQRQVYLNVAEREQIQDRKAGLKEKGDPTPNREQSSLLELPRCEGGKDRKAGLKEKYHAELLLNDFLVYSYFVYLSTEMRIHSAKASPFRGGWRGLSRLLVPRLLVN